LTFEYLFIYRQNLCAFFSTMEKDKKIKNIKIDSGVHKILKVYCEKHGLKVYKFLEKIILENCAEKKDIYGD